MSESESAATAIDAPRETLEDAAEGTREPELHGAPGAGAGVVSGDLL